MKEDDLLDLRTLDEIMGGIPKRQRKKKNSVSVTINQGTSLTVPEPLELSAADKNNRALVKKVGMEHSMEMFMLAVELARNAESESVRLQAIKEVLDRTLGKVANAPIDASNVPKMPNITIKFGDDDEQNIIEGTYGEEED